MIRTKKEKAHHPVSFFVVNNISSNASNVSRDNNMDSHSGKPADRRQALLRSTGHPHNMDKALVPERAQLAVQKMAWDEEIRSRPLHVHKPGPWIAWLTGYR